MYGHCAMRQCMPWAS